MVLQVTGLQLQRSIADDLARTQMDLLSRVQALGGVQARVFSQFYNYNCSHNSLTYKLTIAQYLTWSCLLVEGWRFTSCFTGLGCVMDTSMIVRTVVNLELPL
jgi:hypothetical protein